MNGNEIPHRIVSVDVLVTKESAYGMIRKVPVAKSERKSVSFR